MASRKKKSKNVIEARRHMKYARSVAKTTLEAIDSALEAIEPVAPGGYVDAVKALRTIANAPDGTPAINLKGVARAALKQIDLGAEVP